MTGGLSFGVVICAYSDERRPELAAAVDSVLSQEPAVDQLVVVIDHNDGLLEHARAEFGARATVIANAQKQGLSGARNSGIEAIGTDVIAFLDDDARAEPGWAARIRTAYANDSVIGAGGAIHSDWESPRPDWFPPEFDWVVGCTYRGMPTTTAAVRNLIGANMSLRADVFERVGAFSTTVGRVGKNPVGCEETELCIRALAATPGAEIVYDPAADVQHLVTDERGTWNYFRRRCWAEGISKAQVVRLAGAGQGLSSERSYSTKVLPLGVLRGIGEGLRGRPAGLKRAAAIIAGLAITTAGFVRGRIAPVVIGPGAAQ